MVCCGLVLAKLKKWSSSKLNVWLLFDLSLPRLVENVAEDDAVSGASNPFLAERDPCVAEHGPCVEERDPCASRLSCRPRRPGRIRSCGPYEEGRASSRCGTT